MWPAGPKFYNTNLHSNIYGSFMNPLKSTIFIELNFHFCNCFCNLDENTNLPSQQFHTRHTVFRQISYRNEITAITSTTFTETGSRICGGDDVSLTNKTQT
jgi:hypothetical protein